MDIRAGRDPLLLPLGTNSFINHPSSLQGLSRRDFEQFQDKQIEEFCRQLLHLNCYSVLLPTWREGYIRRTRTTPGVMIQGPRIMISRQFPLKQVMPWAVMHSYFMNDRSSPKTEPRPTRYEQITPHNWVFRRNHWLCRRVALHCSLKPLGPLCDVPSQPHVLSSAKLQKQ